MDLSFAVFRPPRFYPINHRRVNMTDADRLYPNARRHNITRMIQSLQSEDFMLKDTGTRTWYVCWNGKRNTYDDLNDPIHEVLRASFEDQDIQQILSIRYVDTCGKKLASVCPICRISKKVKPFTSWDANIIYTSAVRKVGLTLHLHVLYARRI
jgi:hypothetical protein